MQKLFEFLLRLFRRHVKYVSSLHHNQAYWHDARVHFIVKQKSCTRLCKAEWTLLSREIRSFHFGITFNEMDSSGLQFIVCFPWLISFFLTVPGCWTGVERELGIAIHNQAIWLYLFPDRNCSSSQDPWYHRTYCWHFPWELKWYRTDILSDTWCGQVVYRECAKGPKRDWFARHAEQEKIEKLVERQVPFQCFLKKGVVQECIATYHTEEREWRARWYPLIPRKKVVRSLDVTFSEEMGAGRGSYKGGVTGTGIDLQFGESAQAALTRLAANLSEVPLPDVTRADLLQVVE